MQETKRYDKEDLLKEEYLRIQDFVEHFDNVSITIKAWSVTFSLATLVGAQAFGSWVVVAIAGASSLGFWITEACMRAYQYAYYDRQGRIEKYFERLNEKDSPNTIAPLQLGKSWTTNFAKAFRFPRKHANSQKPNAAAAATKRDPRFPKIIEILFWPEVLVPHVIPFFVACVLLCSPGYFVGLRSSRETRQLEQQKLRLEIEKLQQENRTPAALH